MAISELIMPKMGESIMEATILRWHKNVGDFVKMDETLLDIATDKVDSEVPSTAQGVITELLYNVNDVVPVGSVLARIETEVFATVETPATTAFATSHFEEPVAFAMPEPVYHQPAYSAPQQEFIPFVPTSTEQIISNNNRFFSPLVLNIANSEGLSLSELERIPGTGADGRVSKKDVLQYIADKRAGRVPTYVPQYVQQPQQFFTTPAEPVFTPVSVPQDFSTPIENTLSVPVVDEVIHHKTETDFYPSAETAATVAAASFMVDEDVAPKVEEFIPPSFANVEPIDNPNRRYCCRNSSRFLCCCRNCN